MTVQQTWIGHHGRAGAAINAAQVALVQRFVRGIMTALIIINVLTWAPSVDANGSCNCPLCNPLGSVGVNRLTK